MGARNLRSPLASAIVAAVMTAHAAAAQTPSGQQTPQTSHVPPPQTQPAQQSPPPPTAATQQAPAAKSPPPENAASVAAGGVVPPPGYVIGPEDVLSVLFWREKNLSGDVVVRPDGRISLPLLNDIQAAGLTTDELREKVMTEANKFVEDSTATIIVKQINSRKVFITGNVSKPGFYPLTGPLTVLQLIAIAGGLLEFADSSKIRIMRTEGGKPTAQRFNYKEFSEGKNLHQNIELKPGDTVLVP